MHIAQMMNTSLSRVAPDQNFCTLLTEHADADTRHTYVVDEHGRLLGVITSQDLMGRMVPSYLDPQLASSLADGAELILRRFRDNARLSAADLMQPKPVAVHPEDTLIEANVRLHEGRLSALPVVDAHGILVGEISRRDILRHIARDICGLPGAA